MKTETILIIINLFISTINPMIISGAYLLRKVKKSRCFKSELIFDDSDSCDENEINNK